MKTLLTLFVGIVMGLFVAAQAKVLTLPVIHFPKHLHLDPLAVLLVVIFLINLHPGSDILQFCHPASFSQKMFPAMQILAVSSLRTAQIQELLFWIIQKN